VLRHEDAKLESLDLSGMDLKDATLKGSLQDLLQWVAGDISREFTLKELILRDNPNITKVGWKIVTQTFFLLGRTSLLCLDISNNNLTSEQVEGIIESLIIIKQKTSCSQLALQSLDLSKNHNISCSSYEQLVKFFFGAQSRLVVLNLADNRLSADKVTCLLDSYAAALQRGFAGLQRLDLSQNIDGFTLENIAKLNILFCSCSDLQFLSLRSCCLTSELMAELLRARRAEIASCSHSVVQLDLSGNIELSQEVFSSLLEHLAHEQSKLSELFLEFNMLNSASLSKLCEFDSFLRLKKLSLSHQQDISPKAWATLFGFLFFQNQSQLEHLDIGYCDIDDNILTQIN